MQMRHKDWFFRHHVDQFSGDVLRMGRHETNPADSGELGGFAQKIGKIAFGEVSSVGIDILP